MANQLIHESSLYLQQHAHNPVNWYAWGDEALLKAKTENKPLLISIGYSSCHWCHVMEHESFENEEIAAAMNEGFVCIKVDREERPDVDHRYMNAIMLLHGQGGWPLNCFALPDGTPFWGGTYFRPDVWLKLLKDIAELWEHDSEQILKLSRDLTENVRNDRFRQFSDDLLRSNNSSIIMTACEQMKNHFDLRNGGMNGSPKFPMPVVWNFLLTSDDPEINSHVNFTLKTLCKGGIYDHIGGGFARYCVDREWKVPHFEKMLYDNALLVSLIANACKKSADPLLLETACHTVDFFTREMLSTQGLFYASVDADSEGEEGKYYLWKRNDWNEALGPYANLVGEYYGVDAQALWQKGDNILLRPHDDALFAQQHFLSLEELTALIRRSQNTLLNNRNKRIHPATDQKVITSWNAMFITSLCDLYESSGIDSYLKTALTAIKNLLQHLYPDEQQLFRIFDGNKATIPAFADDYAFLIKSLFRIYQCTAEENYLRIACKLTEKVIEQNFEKDTGFFVFNRTSLKNEPAYFELSDGVIPSSNAILAEMLFVLGTFCDKPYWKTKAENMISFMAGKVAGSPYGYTHWAFLLKMLETDLITIAITGADSENWYKQITRKYLPYTIVAFSQNGSELPYFANRFSKEKIQAFICKGNTCQAPIDSLEKLSEALP